MPYARAFRAARDCARQVAAGVAAAWRGRQWLEGRRCCS
jgi:hypothetical protein